MKRFDLVAARNERGVIKIEGPAGEWVRFEDAERLRSALFRYACHCGRQGEDPEIHSPWCPYRVASSAEPQSGCQAPSATEPEKG